MEEQGHRLTAPRRAVLEAIDATVAPFTVEDLCDVLPGVGRATVFRTIRLLQDLAVLCRVPLEDGTVTVVRTRARLSYPARFTLLAAMNPCPCGYYGDPERECTCALGMIQRYRKRICTALHKFSTSWRKRHSCCKGKFSRHFRLFMLYGRTGQ